MTAATDSPASNASHQARAALRDALHDAPALAALLRDIAEALECHGELFSDPQRAEKMDNEALHKALPLMALARSAAGSFALARTMKQAARRLEGLPATAGALDALMQGDEKTWQAFEKLVCGEGRP